MGVANTKVLGDHFATEMTTNIGRTCVKYNIQVTGKIEEHSKLPCFSSLHDQLSHLPGHVTSATPISV